MTTDVKAATDLSKDLQNPQKERVAVPGRAKLAIDSGNRFLKFADSLERVSIFPSYLHLLEPWEPASPTPDGVCVKYVGGNNGDLIGHRWAVGTIAKDYGGDPTYRGEKADIAPYLLFAAIAATIPHDASHFNIGTLICALPDYRDAERADAIRNAIKGTHHIKVNDRRDVTVRIGGVSVRAEGSDAFRWLSSIEAFEYPHMTNGVLDVGGGNVGAVLFGSNGQMIPRSRMVANGTWKLAAAIATALDGQNLETKGGTPDITRIMDGIARGDYLYGNTGYDFSAEFVSCRKRWIKDIRESIRTQWAELLRDVGEVAIVGGSAVLLHEVCEDTDGRFFIADDPMFCTVRGMLI